MWRGLGRIFPGVGKSCHLRSENLWQARRKQQLLWNYQQDRHQRSQHLLSFPILGQLLLISHPPVCVCMEQVCCKRFSISKSPRTDLGGSSSSLENMAKTWGPIPPVNYLHLRGKVLRRWCWRKGNLGNWNFRTLNNLTDVRKDKTFCGSSPQFRLSLTRSCIIHLADMAGLWDACMLPPWHAVHCSLCALLKHR